MKRPLRARVLSVRIGAGAERFSILVLSAASGGSGRSGGRCVPVHARDDFCVGYCSSSYLVIVGARARCHFRESVFLAASDRDEQSEIDILILKVSRWHLPIVSAMEVVGLLSASLSRLGTD